MSETAVRPATKPKRVQDRWWWPWFVVASVVLSIGMAPQFTVDLVNAGFDWVGDAIEWARQTNCDFSEAAGNGSAC